MLSYIMATCTKKIQTKVKCIYILSKSYPSTNEHPLPPCRPASVPYSAAQSFHPKSKETSSPGREQSARDDNPSHQLATLSPPKQAEISRQFCAQFWDSQITLLAQSQGLFCPRYGLNREPKYTYNSCTRFKSCWLDLALY